jgi:Big-like domain-containing protein
MNFATLTSVPRSLSTTLRRLASAALVVALLLVSGVVPAHAVLQRMGPINNAPTVGGFPAWFQDTTGLTFEFCDLINQAELNGGWCTLIPPAPASAPESFPNNFFIEHFYWDATNITKDALGLGVKVRFMMAMEASFTNGALVIPGQQMTFGRIRIIMNPVPFTGNYTIYHPYGVWNFSLVAGDRLFFTDDVGLGCPGTFDCTLGTSIGPFLLPSPVSGGVEVPPIPDLVAGQDPWYDALVAVGGAKPYPATGKKYVADPGRIGPVTGSPLPPFLGSDGLTHNHNTLRIEGPNGFVIDAPNNFVLTGRIETAAVPGSVNVERAAYGVSAAGNKLDVYATAQETTAVRLPAQPAPAQVKPILSYYEAPCTGAITIDPVTGVQTVNPPPYTAPVAPKLGMAAQGKDVWGQSKPAIIPDWVCVQDDSATNALGQVVPAFYLKPVVDDVAISLASFNGPLNGTLTVNAASSDPASVLTLQAFGVGGAGLNLAAGAASVSGLFAPPNSVQVVSSNGGSALLPVSTLLGAALIGGTPVAVNDTVTMNEDCSALPATSCATPQVISPLANDTLNGGPIPAGAVVTVAQAPRLGTAVVNLNGTITYTPNPNANGSDVIGYTVTVNGVVSNIALINITLTPVADIPTAVPDVVGALRGVLNTANVFANDSDPDGATVLAGETAVIVNGAGNNLPALGLTAGTSYAGGIVTFTPPAGTAAGPYTFNYHIVKNAIVNGVATTLTSADTTVTVNVATSEAIVPQKAIYTQTKGLWVVQGTVSPAAGQTMTITLLNGTYKVNGACLGNAAGTLIGTAVPDSTGLWLLSLSLSNTAGVQNPSNTLGNSTGFWCTPPSSVVIKSSLNPVTPTTVGFPISLK